MRLPAPLRSVLLAGVACACAQLGGTSASPGDTSITAGLPDSVRRDIASMMRAVTPLADPAAADRVGYPATMGACAADSAAGAMGHHLVNRPLFDDKLDIEHPEMLVFAPLGGGKVQLVAVEYVVPYRFVPRDATPPRLFGQDLKHYDKFNYWEIHVWAWKRNPSGIFADWNPDVTCPAT
ncbi:MAG: hypothetical protein H7099_06100 [Gemmatimonadaceae bacterium]|nr:hypothetical protein [Gemmatimonadaceae bacterium]